MALRYLTSLLSHLARRVGIGDPVGWLLVCTSVPYPRPAVVPCLAMLPYPTPV